MLLPAAGRTRSSGYRSVCNFEEITALDGADLVGFELELIDRQQLEPGEMAHRRMRIWADDVMPGPVRAGTAFTIQEGHTTVGVGRVTRESG